MARVDKTMDHLAHIVRRSGPAVTDEGDDDETELPYGWLSPTPLLTLNFEWPDGSKRGFRYIHLDSDMTYSSEQIVLRFFGSKPVEVTISGRNLEQVYLRIGDDRWRVLRQQPRDFAADGETYIGKIDISSLELGD